jgi:hypothetical protein
MRALLSLLPVLLVTTAFATDAPAAPAESKAIVGNGGTAHRYIIERTFPAGALDGVDAAAKKKVNANNATLGVNWVQSYASADKTKTFCEYEGPSEAAVREAAKLSGMPVDKVTEVPVKAGASHAVTSPSTHRFIVAQSGKVDPAKSKASGVHWVTSYANADKTRTYSIYEAPTEAAVRNAVTANGAAIETVMEVPVTLLPN